MDTFNHKTAEGAELTFAHLSLYDIYGNPKTPGVNGLVPCYLDRERDTIVRRGKKCELDKAQIYAEVYEFDRTHKNDEQMWLEFVDTATGRTEVIEYAWTLANPGKAMPKMMQDDWAAVREKLFNPLGLTFKPPLEIAADEEKAKGTASSDASTFGDGGAAPDPQVPPTFSDAGGSSDAISSQSAA